MVDATPERKEEVRESVKTLLRQKDVMNFTLGQNFAEILDGSYWQDYGFQSFDEYCVKEADCHRRKGLDLAKIYRKFGVELGMTGEDIQGYPYSKLVLVSEVITQHNKEGWLKDVLKLTFDQLKYKVQEYREAQNKSADDRSPKPPREDGNDDFDGDDVDDPLVYFKIRMHQAQIDNLKAAMEVCQTMTGSDKESYLLDCIATDFITGHQDEHELTLQSQLESFERIHKVKLSVSFNKGDPRAEDFVGDRTVSTAKKKKGREQKAAQSEGVPA